MNLRPNDELERTEVMKIDEEKERGDLHQGTKHWPGDDPSENKHNLCEGAKKGWEREQHPGTCFGARERCQDVHSSQGNRAEDQKPWWRTWWVRHQETPANAESMHNVESNEQGKSRRRVRQTEGHGVSTHRKPPWEGSSCGGAQCEHGQGARNQMTPPRERDLEE